jgi:hypothetical protein
MGKILNALEFPMSYLPSDNAPPVGLDSDVEAFRNTAGMQYCRLSEAFPFSSMRWGLAATANAYHTFHLDCDGFATYVKVQTGAKWWIIACPKEGVSLADTTLFTSDYQIDKVDVRRFNYEAILLEPSTQLLVFLSALHRPYFSPSCRVMKPGMPHTVVTFEASICHGGHFYATSTICATVYGIMHTLVGSNILTNAEHTTDSRMLLWWLVSYVHHHTVEDKFQPSPDLPTPMSAHVPKLNTADGVVDLFSLLNVIELSNILHPLSYTTSGLQLKERLQMIHARKLGRIILRWFWCNYDVFQIQKGTRKIVKDGQHFYNESLGRQAKALVAYKKVAEACGMASDAEACTAKVMETFMTQIFQGNIAFWEGYNKEPSTSLAWHAFPIEVRVKQLLTAFNLHDCGK